jgi:hypothetical protein
MSNDPSDHAANGTPANIDCSDALWPCYCNFLKKLPPDDLQNFENDLRAARCPQVKQPELMLASIALVRGMAASGVRAANWPPAPSNNDLANLPGWVEQQLASARADQEVEQRNIRWRRRLACELGKATGQRQSLGGTPVHAQRSKHSLEELAKRLEWTIAKHEAEEGQFNRTWLDHRSPHYIRDRDGGIDTNRAWRPAISSSLDRVSPCRWNTLRNGSRLFLGLRGDGAANRIRTCDPVITNDVLYQLSYCGGPSDALSLGAENART